MKHDTAMNPNIFSRFGASKKPNTHTHTHTHTQKKSNWKREKKFIIILIITIIIIRSEVRKRCVFSRSPWNDFFKNISFFLSFLFFFVGVQLRRESRNLAAVSLLPLVSSSFFFSFLFFWLLFWLCFFAVSTTRKKNSRKVCTEKGKKWIMSLIIIMLGIIRLSGDIFHGRKLSAAISQLNKPTRFDSASV